MDLEKLLSAGVLAEILENKKPPNPVLQIIGYKQMTADQMAFGATTDDLRYRLMIGDGVKAHQYCVITNQDLVEDIRTGRLDKWAIIKVTSYQTVDYGDGPPETKRRIIYILNLEIIKRGSEVGRKLAIQDYQPSNVHQDQANRYQQASPMKPRIPSYNQVTPPQPYAGDSLRQDTNRTPNIMGRSTRDQHVIGISELTPYIGKWVIKGRVVSKSAVREYNNAKGGGKVFSFVLADKTGEIKCTAFNSDLERVYPYVEPNKVYLLGRAQVKNADKRYTTADFEITLNNDSLFEQISDHTEDVPMAKFNFVGIASLSNLPPNQPVVDLIGAITFVSEVSTIVSKTKNRELKKRNVVVADMSRHSISITIWGDQADSFNAKEGDIFVTKGAKIGTYGGRSASAGDCIFVNPDIPEQRKMKNWYEGLNDQQIKNFTALTSSQDMGPSGDTWKYLKDMLNLEEARNIVSSGQTSAQYAKAKVILMAVGKNPVYKCCPVERCGKKLVDTQVGELRCDKCQQTYTNYKFRYMTSVEITDCADSHWVTLWDEKAEAVLKKTPEELERVMRMDDKELYERVLSRPTFRSYIFTVRVQIDTYNQEERVRLGVVGIAPLDPVTYSRHIIDEIKMMTSQ